MTDKPMVFGIGFQKTGTSSLRESLKILGYKVKDTSPKALFPILRKDHEGIKRILERYDAAEDTPWFMIYKDLDLIYPGSKFILTTRDAESWYKSVSRHIGSLRSAHHEWIYGRGKGIPSDDKDNTIHVFEQHNLEVQKYFGERPDDLLVTDLTKEPAWDKICQFLDLEIPSVDFPHMNKEGTANQKPPLQKKMKYWRKQMKQNLIMTYLDWRGLW